MIAERQQDPMTFEEKRTWVYGVVAVLGYAAYLVLLLPQLSTPIEDSPYASPMLWSIGGAILAGILGGIVLAIGSPKTRTPAGGRDPEIHPVGGDIRPRLVVAGGPRAPAPPPPPPAP